VLVATLTFGLAAVCGVSGGAAGAQPQEPVSLAFAPELIPAPAVAAAPRPWTDQNCNRCHRPDSFSHPVNVVPSMHVPANLPLHDGRIVCTTCHDNTDADLHAQARRRHDGLLRGAAAGPAFCAQCHDPAGTSRASMHAGMLGQAHLRWPQNAPHPADGNSRLCLSCHDGAIASGIGSAAQDPGHALTGSHPVDIDYRVNPIRHGTIDRSISFTPAAQLDGRVRLFQGQVACASCHNLYNAQPGRLVMSNLRSSLCLSCHVDLR
jgi:predicted CXXCH cytochrome family protein